MRKTKSYNSDLRTTVTFLRGALDRVQRHLQDEEEPEDDGGPSSSRGQRHSILPATTPTTGRLLQSRPPELAGSPTPGHSNSRNELTRMFNYGGSQYQPDLSIR